MVLGRANPDVRGSGTAFGNRYFRDPLLTALKQTHELEQLFYPRLCKNPVLADFCAEVPVSENRRRRCEPRPTRTLHVLHSLDYCSLLNVKLVKRRTVV